MEDLVYHLDFHPTQGISPLETEWLLPDGLGGFAMGTALGTPTRRYHGLLIAAVRPPVERVNVLTQVLEHVTWNDEPAGIWLTPLHFQNADRPRFSSALASFRKGPTWCAWTWRLPGGETIEKRLDLARSRNASRLSYRIEPAGRPGTLELTPLLALRDFHSLSHRTLHEFDCRNAREGLILTTKDAGVLIEHDGLERLGQPELWQQSYYEREAERGQDCVEGLCSPARYRLSFAPTGESVCELRFSAEIEPISNAHAFGAHSVIGLDHTLKANSKSDDEARLAITRLTEAASAFVVGRSGGLEGRPGVTVIAGYPWFADWGRDTMIALPGLLLSTGRHEEALSTLELFGQHVRRGLVPNRFDDYADGAHYNTVDASLWFLHAATEYRLRTGDEDGFSRLVEPCIKIVEAYQHGTDYEIHLDHDGLIAAGSAHTQLTWMDAQRDGVTFTPRFGKCVEINALWHHGLRRLLAALPDHAPYRISELEALADHCAESFARFVCPQGGLYDRLQPAADHWEPVPEIRPNQIFAASLPDSPLDLHHRANIVATVREHLLTPFGLRTLAPSDPNYCGRYTGNLFQRDAAYHNGTVWPWLLGHYVEAAWRADDSDRSRAHLRELLRPLTARMQTACLGQVSEVCQGDAPHEPDGCPAQAWSVAELLRAWIMLASNNTSDSQKNQR